MTDSIRLNGETRPYTAATIADLLHSLGIEAARPGLAVAVNGRIVPRSRWAAAAIAAGDEVDVVRPAQGG